MNTKLISKETVAEGTMLFRFEKPEGFEYKAGQSIDLTLVNPPETDEKGNTRPFSLVSAPFEKELAIATRMRDSAFKRVLKDMRGGEELAFEGPFGDLTLHENAKRKAVILAGGIGITPFRSIVAQATFQSLPHRITLLYSNRRPEDAAFLAEFHTFAQTNPNFTFVPTMTAMEQSSQDWDGECGYIDAAMIGKHFTSDEAALYYLAGPAAMVAAMRKIVNDMEVSNDDIRTEEFSGY